jgi:Fe-Mn family superoxide dismutase
MNAKTTGPFQLPPLPWSEYALEPVTSSRTIGLHYGKHHKTYVDKLNELVAGTPLADLSLEDLVKKVAGDPDKKKVFNNGAQHWNHSFFWKCLSPKGGGEPRGELARRIDADLGGFAAFRKQFEETAVNTFGSGWAWLALKDGKLQVMSTSNAGTPITEGATPLLTVDVWEHAYYVDHENRRPEFVKAVCDKLLNWDFAQQQLDGAGKERKAA